MFRRRAARLALLALAAPMFAVPALLGGNAQAAVASTCKSVVPVYGIDRAGTLRELVDTSAAGPTTVQAAPSTPASGWQGYQTVVAAGYGVLYTISTDGTLRWWRHLGSGTGARPGRPAAGR